MKCPKCGIEEDITYCGDNHRMVFCSICKLWFTEWQQSRISELEVQLAESIEKCILYYNKIESLESSVDILNAKIQDQSIRRMRGGVPTLQEIITSDEWAVGHLQADGTLHVWPIKEDNHSEVSTFCWCNPLVELQEKGTLVIHNRRQ
jgi:hypothetical protein